MDSFEDGYDAMTKSRKLFLLIVIVAVATGSGSTLIQSRQQEVAFANGNVQLAGTLHLPRTSGPHPAIIVIHGSGDDRRENYRIYADLLVKKGFAVLVYDKRGVGSSGGSWKSSPFSALADDALAGVNFLVNHSAVDCKRIGVWGGSEGAAIAPWVATRSSNVAFVIMQSASGVTFAKQNLHQNEQSIRAHTSSADDIAQGLRVVELQAEVARTGKGWQAYADAKAAIREKPWASTLGPTVSADSWWWQWYRTKLDFDPVPVLERVRVPVFAAWGGNDRLVPVAASRTAIENALARGGNRDVTCIVYPNADHSLQSSTWLGVGPDRGYVRDMTAWACKQARLDP